VTASLVTSITDNRKSVIPIDYRKYRNILVSVDKRASAINGS